jgi:hypothetical protein
MRLDGARLNATLLDDWNCIGGHASLLFFCAQKLGISEKV